MSQFSKHLYNKDLAPTQVHEKKWGVFSIFNVWTSDVHSLWGYYLAASLFLLSGSFWNFLIAIGIGSIFIFVLMNLVGLAGEKTGVPYPVLARASFGVWGANLPALIRAIVACFWYGAQTAAASGALVALLLRNDSMLAFHQNTHLFGHSGLEVICYLVMWALQLLIIQKGMETVRQFQDWAGPAVWLAMLALAIGLSVKAGGFSFSHHIPQDVLLRETQDAGVQSAPGTWSAILAVAATWVTYFAALYLNFCDFSRYAKDEHSVRVGNLWGLPVNLILFSIVAGVTTISAYQVYGEVLLHPEAIASKFDSLTLAILAALTFAVATLGINVVANFVSPAFDFANVLPNHIDFKRGGYIAAVIALVLYPFSPWDGNASNFVNAIGAIMGPLLGIILADYYLIQKRQISLDDLYSEHGRYYYFHGWNINALITTIIGIIVCVILPHTTHIMPSWWGVYGWFIGVILGIVVYGLLSKSVHIEASNKAIPLKIEPLTKENFAPFGEVIEIVGEPSFPINGGTTARYHDLGQIEFEGTHARASISMARGDAFFFPISVKMLERHPFGSQAWLPVTGVSFVIVVAPNGVDDKPDESGLRVFYAQKGQGVNYKKGTWHHPLLTHEKQGDYIVIDRIGEEKNCDEENLTHTYIINGFDPS